MTFIIFYFTLDAFGRAGDFNILEGAGMAVVVDSLERICWERQRSWSSGHLNVRVFHWRIQIREGAAFVVLVCLVPNEIPLGLGFFFSKISRTIKFGCMLLGFLSLKFISRTSTTIFNVILR